MLDKAKTVRQGEELDIHAVQEWLLSKAAIPNEIPKVTQYSGGASNWTYCLTYSNMELILRRPPAGTKAKSAHDMNREFQVQSKLKPVFPYVPQMVALCKDENVIGCEFYVMEKLTGIIPRANLPKELVLKEQEVRKLCINVLDKLIELHQVDYKAAGLSSLGKGEGYTKRQIEGWTTRYEKARTWNVPTYKKVSSWLNERIPNDVDTCVIHNDYRFDNVVLNANQPTEVIGILDWELSTLGDPLMELGSSLAYWIEAKDNMVMRSSRRQPTNLKGMFKRQEVVEYYLDKMNFKIDNWAFYEVYGLFRLAGILQQIYYRYHHKQTNNPAFKNFWILANVLNLRCLKIIKSSKK
jgi:aminoglycoside phosphotransferase (APT) family kinase protein